METLQKVFIEIGIPYQVVFAIIAIVFLTEWTKSLVKNIEIYLEENIRKRLRFLTIQRLSFGILVYYRNSMSCNW